MTGLRPRLLDPFDVMRATRALAPHDPRLNDIRWLTGQALRGVHEVATRDEMKAAPFEASPRADTARKARIDPVSVRLHARERLAACEEKAGPAAWTIVRRIVLEGACVRDCREHVPEIVTPWRCDAVISDRLRVALDALGPLLNIREKP